MFPCHLQFLLFGNQIRFGITENIIFCGIFTISLFFEVAGNHKTSLRNYRIEAYTIPHPVFFGIQFLTELTSLAGQHVIHLNCPNKRNGKAINTPGKDLYDTLWQSDIGFSYPLFSTSGEIVGQFFFLCQQHAKQHIRMSASNIFLISTLLKQTVNPGAPHALNQACNAEPYFP